MKPMWIGPDETLSVGLVGFLVEISNRLQGRDRYELRDTPPTTNQSYQPRLYGWCGSYNDTNTHGRGLWRVERVARNGRAFVVELSGSELAAGLEELGYPELLEQAKERQS